MFDSSSLSFGVLKLKLFDFFLKILRNRPFDGFLFSSGDVEASFRAPFIRLPRMFEINAEK